MKALVGAFNQQKALVGAFSLIVKTGCGTDGALHSTSPWLYLMCVSSRLRAQRDKCTVHPHHNSTMFNYSPSKDAGQLSFKLVDIFMDDRGPTKSVSGSDLGTCSPTNLENGELEIKIISQSARSLQLEF